MKPIPLLLVVLVVLALPAAALADGGAAMNDAALKAQPARTLAQQALAVLDVKKDDEAARMRIDAALESKHREDVDLRLLAQADDALDGGDRERAVELLNRALGGGPLPIEDAEASAPSGGALHNAGRAFEPNSTDQETIAAIAGALLLLLGVLLVLRHRRRAPTAA